MTKKTRTIDYIKEKRSVPEELKERRKEYARIRKAILNVLKEGDYTIPELAAKTGLPLEIVTYNLMTLRKYGDVITGELDDMDEYFYYKLKQ